MWNIHVFRYLALFVQWTPSLYLLLYNFSLAVPPSFFAQIQIVPPCSVLTCFPPTVLSTLMVSNPISHIEDS